MTCMQKEADARTEFVLENDHNGAVWRVDYKGKMRQGDQWEEE